MLHEPFNDDRLYLVHLETSVAQTKTLCFSLHVRVLEKNK